MDQPEADWGHWSLNNASDITPLLEPEADLTSDQAQESKPNADQVLPGEEGLGADYTFDYDDDLGHLSGSADSQQSENDILEEVTAAVSPGVEDTSVSLPAAQSIATCEYCGTKGERDRFYSKLKKFCSIACSHKFTAAIREGKAIPVLKPANSLSKPLKPSQSPGKKLRPGSQPRPKPQVRTIPSASKQNVSRSFDWGEYLTKTRASGAPVSCFKHCFSHNVWHTMITVGMKVEVVNTDCDVDATVYWIATVIKLAGYKALMRYEGFGSDPSKDFWTNLSTGHVQPVGWCAANNKSLVPPKTIQYKYLDWKDFLVKRLTGARTLPLHFYKHLQEGLQSCPLKQDMRVEVVDKMCVSAMRVATVAEIVGGARVRLQYVASEVENDDFWCHHNSPLIHPIGWSQLVGHKLHASTGYKTESLNKAALKKYSELDANPTMFKRVKDLPNTGLRFMPNMKLEAIDPLNLSCICVATVMKVLRNNYLMIGIDGSMSEEGYDWFCYHATSPCIFPVGFCEINGLELTPPRDYKGRFSWLDYLKQTRSVAAPVKLFDQVIPKHGFKVGSKLEAVDLMEPRLICVGCVVKVVGRLLRIHFDGWESSYDQWVDCESPDIYPVGWCEMVKYHLEGPKSKESPPVMPSVGKKRKSKSQMYRGPRKKRKPKLPLPAVRLGPHGSVSQIPAPRLAQQCSVDSSEDSLALESPSSPAQTQAEPNTTAEAEEDAQSEKHLASAPGSLGPTPPVVTEAASASLSLETMVASETDTLLPDLLTSEISVLPPVTVASVASPVTVGSVLLPVSETLALVSASVVATAGMEMGSSVSETAAVESLALSSKCQTSLAVSLPRIVTMLKSPIKQPSSVLPAASPQSLLMVPQQAVDSAAAVTVAQTWQTVPHGIDRPVSHSIPCVMGDDFDGNRSVALASRSTINPQLWSVLEVCQFLRANDSGAFCEGFRRKNIDGSTLLTLSKEQIVGLTGMKVGQSLKIHDMIQALKQQVAQQATPTNVAADFGRVTHSPLS